MIEAKDQLGRKITLGKLPERIISIVPSQTELLADLDLEKKVIGITKFCVHPDDWFRTKTRIGGTKNLDFEKIKHLRPDLIIANREENERTDIEKLAKHFPVWVSDIKTLEDALEMILAIGQLCGKAGESKLLAEKIKSAFDSLKPESLLPAAYFIWRKPYMAAGGDTFINEMLEKAGFENAFKKEKRYPVVNLSDLKSLNPKVILLSSEPFPFREKHIEEIKEELPDIRIRIVDGEMFSWYGSRLIKAVRYFKKLRKEIFEN